LRGYYALPLLWRDEVIGWGNLSMPEGRLAASFGYITGRAPRDAAFRREMDAELERMEAFLRITARAPAGNRSSDTPGTTATP
jgi:uncharacterized protein YcaQ